MKKLLFFLMFFAVFLMIVATIAVNTPTFIKNVTHDFLLEHNITYKKIDGDVIKGISIDDIKYNKIELAGRLNVIWSPLSLLEKKVVIYKGEIDDLNITNMKNLIATFKNSNTKSSNVDLSLIVQKAKITTTQYTYGHYIFKHGDLNISNLDFDLSDSSFKSGDVDLKTELNYGTVALRLRALGGVEFTGDGDVSVNQTFYDRYHIPLDAKNVYKAKAKKIDINKDGFTIYATTSGKQIFKDINTTNNLDATEVNSVVKMDFKTRHVGVDSTAKAVSHYAPQISITNYVDVPRDGLVTYKGTITAPKITSLDKRALSLLDNPKVHFSGSEENLRVGITTDEVVGSYLSTNLKDGILNLKSKKELQIKEYLHLPKSLQDAKGIITASIIPISLTKPYVESFSLSVDSNLANIDAKVKLGKPTWQIENTIKSIPQNSILKNVYKIVKWDTLVGSNINLDIGKESTNIDIKAKNLQSNLTYKDSNDLLSGKVLLSGITADILGNTQSNINIKANASDLSKGLLALSEYLDFTPPLLWGSATGEAVLNNKGKVDFILKSPNIFLSDNNRGQSVNDCIVNGSYFENKLTISSYSFIYETMTLYASKPSVMTFQGSRLSFAPLWVNNQLQVSGNYDMSSKRGSFDLNGKDVAFSDEYASVKFDTNLKANIANDMLSLDGRVLVTSGNILYYLEQKSFPTDSDIVIVQNRSEKQGSQFWKNLSMNIKIDTKNPIRYNQHGSLFDTTLDMQVQKVQDENMLLLGIARILKNGQYLYGDKKFILQPSSIYFTGDIDRPLLNIQATYKSPNYSIRTMISGTPGNPNINFSSTPKLTKEQILALLLFDSEVAADNYTSDEMAKMMGGAVAKSLLSNMGISLDHLVIGSNNSIEVGKKINRRTTLIYANDEVSKAKLKYEFNPSIDGVLSVSQISTSGDIIYKKEFKSLKDLFHFSSKKDENQTSP